MGHEVEFLPVGNSNGDAICVRYGDDQSGYKIHVIDGGRGDTGQTIIDHVRKYYGNPNYIDNVVLSHQDADHVTGLIDVVRHFSVGALWMNRPWRFAAEIKDSFHGNWTEDGLTAKIRSEYPLLVELEAVALSKNIPVYDAFAGATIGGFTVLAPTREKYLELIPQFDRTPTSYARPDKSLFGRLVEAAKSLVQYFETWTSEALQENPAPTSASNECCVVQLGRFGDRSVLLTADAGPDALNRAAEFAAGLGLLSPPTFVQVPHHGSRRNVTPSVLNRWLGNPLPEGSPSKGTAFCSVGSNKSDYPRRRVSNAFLRRGYPVYKTGTGWIRHCHDMPTRPGSSPIGAIPFSNSYEE